MANDPRQLVLDLREDQTADVRNLIRLVVRIAKRQDALTECIEDLRQSA